MHHFIPLDLVDHVDSHVHLSKSATEVMDEWEDEEPMELEDDEEQADAAGKEGMGALNA